MKVIRQLLCPVDLSERSAEALRYARALRSLLNAQLAILHVSETDAQQPDEHRSSDASLEAWVSNVIGLEALTQLLEHHGDPVEGTLRTAAAIAADVVVMGSHGRTGLQRLLLGSVTERVIRRAMVPVLTVPLGWSKDEEGGITLANVLCAVDFSEPSKQALDLASAIAAARGLVCCLFMYSNGRNEVEERPSSGKGVLPFSEDDAMAGMNALLTNEVRTSGAPEFVVRYGAPADEVLRVVHERQVGLVVLGIRRRNPIDLAVFGSTAQRLIREGRCAVLTMHAGES